MEIRGRGAVDRKKGMEGMEQGWEEVVGMCSCEGKSGGEREDLGGGKGEDVGQSGEEERE